jgi:hypothetical protein
MVLPFSFSTEKAQVQRPTTSSYLPHRALIPNQTQIETSIPNRSKVRAPVWTVPLRNIEFFTLKLQTMR